MQANLPGEVTQQGGIYGGKAVGWPSGIDAFSHPLFVNELQLRWLENAVTQGGFVQTRPGYKTRLSFDTTVQGSRENDWWQAVDGPVVHPQMMVRFRPSNGQDQLVFAISGSVFYCLINNDGSLSPWTLIQSFQFNPLADQIVGVRCIQSATIIAGKYANNITPKNLLIIQDGVNRAGIWDGITGIHMNPVKMIQVIDGNTLYPEAYNQTRIGLWMAWSGNRLWVSNGANVYASDLNDPTHFTEELNLQSVPVFTFEDTVTGMCDRGTSGSSRSQVVVFTARTTETLWSGVQNRIPTEGLGPGWAFTDDFRTKIFDGVGCVAGKSIIVHRGLLYWKSQGGIVLFDSTQTVNSSQNIPPIDQEMAFSKLRITPAADGMDLTCAGRFNNYVWWSVPVGTVIRGRRYCQQTQVLDRQTTVVRSVGIGGAFQAGTTGWQGVWTGIRPVEWASSNTGGNDLVYALSVDADGVVRIWQAFQANRSDNGQRIPWYMETRLHAVQPTIFENATFANFRLLMDQLLGTVDVVGYWRGLKGSFHELLTTQIAATPGSVYAPFAPYSPMVYDTPIDSFSLQGRTILSRSQKGVPGPCNSAGVESAYNDAVDHAFGLAFRVLGRGAISAYIIYADPKADTSNGSAVRNTGVDESGFNVVPQAGCPRHIDGTAPTYTAGDEPQSLVVCPYLPVGGLETEYVAPAA